MCKTVKQRRETGGGKKDKDRRRVKVHACVRREMCNGKTEERRKTMERKGKYKIVESRRI